VLSNQQQNKLGDVSRCLVENIIISLLVGHKLKKSGIFAFNEDLAQLDDFYRVKNSFVGFGRWLGVLHKLNKLQ
jgi:hypothetical protein